MVRDLLGLEGDEEGLELPEIEEQLAPVSSISERRRR
jgi:hypothetical protein